MPTFIPMLQVSMAWVTLGCLWLAWAFPELAQRQIAAAMPPR
jgi:hypothetical protein